MVRRKVHQPEMHITYLLKSGQTLENIKPSERTRALIVPESTFQRFVDYTTEEDRIIEQQEKAAAKLAALRKAAYEKTKTWDDTIKNIKARQREELLSKRQKAEEERKIFVKEMTEEKVAEHAEVVKQARKLLLQKKPLCRRINRALLTSECLRELDAQIEFQKTIQTIDKEQDIEYVNSIKADVAKHEEQKKQEAEERAKKIKDYRMALKKQIEEIEHDNKLKVAEELEAEKQDQNNIIREIQLMKENEMQDVINKKKKLQQFFKEAIEEKKRLELELKCDEELEDQVLKIYQRAKDRIQKLHKSIAINERKERKRQLEVVAEQHSAIAKTEFKEQEIFKKAVEEKEAAEAEKRKAQKEREKTMHALMEEYKLQDAAIKAKRSQEEKELKTWEMLQRFKRDECNKQHDLEERKQQQQRKLEYGDALRKNFEEKQMERKREEILDKIQDTNMKTAIEKINEKILFYGKEVLEESKGVRPLYPIIMAIEECKKEMGLIPTKKVEETVRVERPKRKRGIRRIHTKPVPADQIYYLQ